jgi:hypothetical protein
MLHPSQTLTCWKILHGKGKHHFGAASSSPTSVACVNAHARMGGMNATTQETPTRDAWRVDTELRADMGFPCSYEPWTWDECRGDQGLAEPLDQRVPGGSCLKLLGDDRPHDRQSVTCTRKGSSRIVNVHAIYKGGSRQSVTCTKGSARIWHVQCGTYDVQWARRAMRMAKAPCSRQGGHGRPRIPERGCESPRIPERGREEENKVSWGDGRPRALKGQQGVVSRRQFEAGAARTATRRGRG